MIKYFILFLPVIIIAGLFKFNCGDLDFQPKVKEIKSFEITSLTNDSITAMVSVDILNENPVNIDLTNTELNFVYGGKHFGKTSLIKNISLPANNTITVNLNCVFDTKKMVKLFSQNKDTVEFKLVGTTTSGFIVSQNIDISTTVKIPMKDIFNKALEEKLKSSSLVSIENAYLKNLGLSNSVVEVTFVLNNPYDLTVKAKKYPSKLFINDSYSGKGDFNSPITINKKGKVSKGVITYSVSNLSALSSVFSTLLSGKLEYKIKGDLLLEIENIEIKLPFEHKGTLIRL